MVTATAPEDLGGTFQAEGTPSARTQGELGGSQVRLRVGKTATGARAQERRGTDHTAPRARQAGRVGAQGLAVVGKRSRLALEVLPILALLSASIMRKNLGFGESKTLVTGTLPVFCLRALIS